MASQIHSPAPSAPIPTSKPQSDFEALTSRTALVRDRAADFLGVESAALLKVLRAHFDDGQGGEFSALELLTAITLIGRYQLDPMRREIHVVRSRGRVFTCIGIDGWIRVVTGNPHYDGHEHEFELDANGRPIACTVRIFHRERSHATSYTALLDEWLVPTNPNWKQRPGHMLQLRAFTHAARYFSAIGQVYEAGEIDDMIARENARDDESYGSAPSRVAAPRFRAAIEASRRKELEAKAERAAQFAPAEPAKGRMSAPPSAPPSETLEDREAREAPPATPWDADFPDEEAQREAEPQEAPASRLSLAELIELAKELGISGASAMKRAELEAAIRDAEGR